MRRLASMVIMVVLTGACLGSASATSEEQGVEDPTPTSGTWGPLAVASPSEISLLSSIVGLLRITDECVFVEEQGEEVLVIWPSDRTMWNPASKTISFEQPGGQLVTLHDRDAVRLGGGGSAVDEGGASAEVFTSTVEWVAEPQAVCVTDVRWIASGVDSLLDS